MTCQRQSNNVLTGYLLPVVRTSITAALLMSCLVPQANASEALENRLKAAFIYNFTRFIEWPGTAGQETLTICVLGKAVLARELGTIDGKHAQGKRIVVKHLDNTRKSGQCQVLFARVDRNRQRHALLNKLATQAVLTVSDSRGFAEAGGIVQFFITNNRVRFAINKEAAERAGLTISSKLLSLARIVGVDEMAGL